MDDALISGLRDMLKENPQSTQYAGTLPERLKVIQCGDESETKKAPKLNFLGKFCRQKSLLEFWPMGGQKKV